MFTVCQFSVTYSVLRYSVLCNLCQYAVTVLNYTYSVDTLLVRNTKGSLVFALVLLTVDYRLDGTEVWGSRELELELELELD